MSVISHYSWGLLSTRGGGYKSPGEDVRLIITQLLEQL